MGFHRVFPAPRRIGVLLGVGTAWQAAAPLACGSPDGSVLEHPPTVRTTVPRIYDQLHTWRGPGGVARWQCALRS